jgi:hypothetical protein
MLSIKAILTILFLFDAVLSFSQNVGIDTTLPLTI